MKNQTTKQNTKQTTKQPTKPSTATVRDNTQSKLEKYKFEAAKEIGVPLKDGYNGDLTSAQNGAVGGQMVKKMIEEQKKQISRQK